MRTILLDASDGPSLTSLVREVTGEDLRHLLDHEGTVAAIRQQAVDLVVDARHGGPPLDVETSMPVVVCIRDSPDGCPPSAFYAPRREDAIRAVLALASTLARKERKALDAMSTPQRITRWLLDAAPVAIGVRQVKGDDFVHVLDNRLSAAIYGKTPDEIVGRSDKEIGISQGVIDQVLARFDTARAENRAIDFEFDFSSKDTPRLLRGKLAPMRLEGSNAEYMAFVAENVSEVRQLQAQLLHADRLASLGSMAASIGHEIKNPASVVILNLTNALDLIAEVSETLPVDTVDEMEASLQSAIGGIRRISALVNDLQSLASSSEQGLRPVEMRAVVDSVIALVGAQLRGRASVRHEHEAGTAVNGNAVRLAQAVLTLLRRAHQALEKKEASRNTVTVRTRPEGGEVVVEVLDNARRGEGVPPEGAFDPFSTQPADGGGPGLYTCRSLIEEYGGSVGAERLASGESRLWFRLPGVTEPT